MPNLTSLANKYTWGKYTSTRTNACIITPVTDRVIVIDRWRFYNYSNTNSTTVRLAGYTTSTGITSTQWIGAPRKFSPYGTETSTRDFIYRLTKSYGLFLSHTAASSCGYEVAYHLE